MSIVDNEKTIPRILIAAPKSGSGKTLFTCGLLKLLKDEGNAPFAFKCGPDYIDPLFHKRVLGIESYNLDSFFMNATQLNKNLLRAEGAMAVIEGVMGIYDGLGVDSVKGSCYEIAALTDTPILLIVDAHGAGRSIISVIKGILTDDDKKLIRGVVLNRISAGFYAKLSPVLKDEIKQAFPYVSILGGIPNDPALKIGSRHLGLDISAPDPQVLSGIERMAEHIKQYVDHEHILKADRQSIKPINSGSDIFPADGEPRSDIKERLQPDADKQPQHDACEQLQSAEKKQLQHNACEQPHPAEKEHPQPVLAVAWDEAFCFYYRDNLDMFEQQGITVKYFSPIHDKALPKDSCGILLGGGYPELYLKELSGNVSMLTSIRNAVNDGMPSLAECGGFMYLHKSVSDIEGNDHKLVGVIDGECRYTGKSVRFGYMEIAEAEDDSPAFAKMLNGMKGHEFHYYESSANKGYCTAQKPDGSKKWNCMCGGEVSLWGFPHFYYPSAPECIRYFVTKMTEYYGKKGKDD